MNSNSEVHSASSTPSNLAEVLPSLSAIQDPHVLIVGANRGIGLGFVRGLLSIPTIKTVAKVNAFGN